MPPLLAIVGETASGKSALALALAERLDGEIICADSWTVYRGFDIGTAKPSTAEMNRVPHHLLDVANAEDGFSAPQFQRLARQAIHDIGNRGKLPIMVGGTGLYIDSVLFNYSFLPPSDPALRQELNELPLSDLLARADAMELDSSMIDRRNKRRVIRLIENNGQVPTKHEQRANSLVFGLRVPRDELNRRIEQRVDAMMTAGLEGEVRHLAERYGWQAEPMKGIGYQEWRPFFDGSASKAEVRQRIIKDTRDLAKRQRTWFKRNTFIHWLDNREDVEQIVDLATTKLNK